MLCLKLALVNTVIGTVAYLSHGVEFSNPAYPQTPARRKNRMKCFMQLSCAK